MPKIPKFLQFASITKKITLALIGLFLMLFLLTHLGINLCMLRNDGGAWFRAAAHFMGTNYIVKVFEIVLFASIGLHILLALIIQFENWRARPVGYASRNKSKTAFGSKLMIWTGILIALFLAVHFVHFYFAKVDLVEGRYKINVESLQKSYAAKQFTLLKTYDDNLTDEEYLELEEEFKAFYDFLENNEELYPILVHALLHGGTTFLTDLSKADAEGISQALNVDYEPDFYVMAHELFKREWVVVLYLLFMIALGFHLMHAFQSAFRTLGAVHSKYTCIIKIAGTAFAIVVSVGFAIIPVFFYFFK